MPVKNQIIARISKIKSVCSLVFPESICNLKQFILNFQKMMYLLINPYFACPTQTRYQMKSTWCCARNGLLVINSIEINFICL